MTPDDASEMLAPSDDGFDTSSTASIDTRTTLPLPKNIFRELLSHPQFAPIVGRYYSAIHVILPILYAATLLFVSNISVLVVLLFIVAFNFAGNCIIHDCPLTALERRYLGDGESINERFRDSLCNMGICYEKGEIYESQLEAIVNFWCLIVFKILGLALMRYAR